MEQYFEFKTAKRYFHIVAFKFESKFTIRNFWKDCDINLVSQKPAVHDSDEVRIEQIWMNSEKQYYFGEIDYSVNQNLKAPYRYDLFAIELKRQNVFIFGFPFKSLAKELMRKLTEERNYKTKGAFLKPNLGKLIRDTNSQDFGNDLGTGYFSSLSITITGDQNITSIDLGGDRPLESSLYKKNFKRLIEEEQSHVEKGIVRCQTTDDEMIGIPRTRSNIHLDHFGNFKMYVHGSGKNLFTLPFIFTALKATKCLQNTLTNPLINLNDEQT